MTDILLVFPPQWSPFQPPLSLPSLSAWLKRAGFSVSCRDLNVLFYEWLLSDDCAKLLVQKVDEADWGADQKLAFRQIFSGAREFRASVENLMSQGEGRSNPEQYITRHYVAAKSLDTYLAAVSEVYEEFKISPYHFELKQGSLNIDALERLVASPPDIIDGFFQNVIAEHIIPARPRMVGLSCIGQEQLYFTLLLGAHLKRRLRVPVVVGGTIFARIFERGSLKLEWFADFFDLIVRNEGEVPCERILSNLTAGRPLEENVPGLVYRSGRKIVASSPSCPLKPDELPVPDFDDMPLTRYLSAEVTLPILSSRGCYWGKCEFCHHGMVYGEKYSSYGVGRVLETVRSLSQRYKVSHFAFNDEAIPPKIIRYMGRSFPPNAETGWFFTALIKFEKYFEREDFENLSKIGFRSLYVGLESASERVLSLMKKRNRIETIVQNLSDATAADIWMHCFLFFGFPGETEQDAQQTYDFVLSHSDIIGLFGCGTFSLEHNAPIFSHLEDFGVDLKAAKGNDVDVYYNYETARGITPERAREWSRNLNDASLQIPKYRAVGWIPPEHLLGLLSVVPAGELVDFGLAMDQFRGLPQGAKLLDLVGLFPHPDEQDAVILINRVNRRVLSMTGNSAELMRLFYDGPFDVRSVVAHCPVALDWLGYLTEAESSAPDFAALSV